MAAWLDEHGWTTAVLDARTIHAERPDEQRRRARRYVLRETLIGRRWEIVRDSVQSRRHSEHDEGSTR